MNEREFTIDDLSSPYGQEDVSYFAYGGPVGESMQNEVQPAMQYFSEGGEVEDEESSEEDSPDEDEVEDIGEIPSRPEAPQEFSKGGLAKKAAQLLKELGVVESKVAGKELTTMQDFHTSLGDSIRERAAKMQQQMDAMEFKYGPGQYVFTEDSARKNFSPFKILGRTMVGNNPIREPHPDYPIMGKVVKDPVTGKTLRTPYEPGYKVRHERGPDDWAEFNIPQSAIKGTVDGFAKGGVVKKATQMLKEVVDAPSVALRGKLAEVEKYVREREGKSGAERLQRAADEIKNLEDQYTTEALQRAFTGDNAKLVMVGDPSKFQDFATRLEDPYRPAVERYWREMSARGGGAPQVPFLIIRKEEGLLPFIAGHEGRHRNIAANELGYPSTLWQLLSEGQMREPLPRSSKEEYLAALKAIAGDKPLVIPQDRLTTGKEGKPVRDWKKARNLPEPFKDGGPVNRAQGSPIYGEIPDSGPITADTRAAFKAKGPSASSVVSESARMLRNILGEGVSNLESAVRGSVAAIPGSVGDIESIFRESDKTRRFATTEEVLRDYMPKRATKPTKEAKGFEEVGSYLPLPIPAGTVSKAAGATKRGAKKALEELGPVAGGMLETAAARTGASPMYVVKPKGGNWVTTIQPGVTLKNSPEDLVHRNFMSMRELNQLELERVQQRIANMREALRTAQGQNDTASREVIERQSRRLPELEAREKELAAQKGLNDWLGTKLVRYIKNEMATPEDPVRALIETGVLPSPTFRGMSSLEGGTARRRTQAGYPSGGLAESLPAKIWENLSDQSVDMMTAGQLLQQAKMGAWASDRVLAQKVIESNPWLSKLDPEERVYMISEDALSPGGQLNRLFDHVVDELGSAVSPSSNLPENLRLTPEKLEKLTVPQAVERVAKIGEWRAEEAARIEKAGMLENLKGESRFPEPNMKLSFVEEPGGTWINLPDTRDEAGKRLCQSIGGAAGWCTKEDTNALKYGSGDNRLSVLLDTTGRPHIQVSIKEPTGDKALQRYVDSFQRTWGPRPTLKQERALESAIQEWKVKNPDSGSMGTDEVVEALKEAGIKPPPNIVEIKPPENSFSSSRSRTYEQRDPSYRQQSQKWALNFLNSQEWGKVEKPDDLREFGIIDIHDLTMVSDVLRDMRNEVQIRDALVALSDAVDANPDMPRFVTRGDFLKLIGQQPQKFSTGGAVKKPETTKEPTTPGLFSQASKLLKNLTSSAPANTTLNMAPYESMYTVKDVGSPEKGRKAALNVYSSLLPALMRARFPDYVANSPARVLKEAPRGAQNVGEFDVFYRTIALDPEGTNSMLMEPYGKYGYVGMGSNTTTDETLNALGTLLHESMHARTRGAEGKKRSAPHPVEQLKKAMPKDRFDEMIRDIRVSDLPSVYSAPNPAEVINEYFATATPVKHMVDKDMVTKRSRRYLAEVDRLAKKYPELEKMRVTWERPELFFKD